MINLKKWIINDRGGLFLDEGGGDVARKTREFLLTLPHDFYPPPESEILDEG